MRFVLLVFITSIFSVSLLYAQKETLLFPVVKDGKYGYINIKGDIAISYMYDDAHYFFEGLAAVKQNNKYGFINSSNKIIVEPQFDTVKHFSEGVCAVGTFEQDKPLQWGYIDKKGIALNLHLPAIGYATNFSSNRAIVAEQGYADLFIISKQGKRYDLPTGLYCYEDERIQFSEGILRVQKNMGIGMFQIVYVDTNATLIPELNTNYGDMGDLVHGLITFYDNGKYGFLNNKGKVIINADFDTVCAFSEGLAMACTGRSSVDGASGLGQYGFIDKNGKWIIHPQPLKCYPFQNGYARIEVNGKYGFMNTSGTVVVPAEYEAAYDFFRGLAYVKKEGHWEYINTTGNRVWWQSF